MTIAIWQAARMSVEIHQAQQKPESTLLIWEISNEKWLKLLWTETVVSGRHAGFAGNVRP